jgi:tRNA modification GTPase
MGSDEDTIFALTTAPGRAAVAVIRISGPDARAVDDVFGFAIPKARWAGLRTLRHNGVNIDQTLVLFFKAPSSYTGEDLVELQIHGGKAVYDSVVSVLATQPGFRFADPGEFSRRAVLNGRLDLTEAEAVNDLVNAETEAQRVFALRQLEGSLSRQFAAWAAEIVTNRAHLEAYIDFPDEEIPESVVEALVRNLANMAISMGAFLDDGRRGERLRSGLRIAVVGLPNAGKSTFVNWLTGRDVAIVSDIAGTTRDVIETRLDLGGYPVIVADTAGLRTGGDVIEVEGMRRAREWAEGADLRIAVVDSSNLGDLDVENLCLCVGDVVLLNKADLVDLNVGAAGGAFDVFGECFSVSLVSGSGLSYFLERLVELAKDRMAIGAGPVISRERHRSALSRCLESVERASAGLKQGAVLEIVAEDLRLGSEDLGRITGRVDVEDLLDVVFRDFCIGK